MKILGIESSCDESALALFDSDKGILSEIVHSQIDLHALYGGVVPDLASTQHLEKLPLLIKKFSEEFLLEDLDFIACTNGPGLPNCLAIGIAAASALALKNNIELCGVNHLVAHALSPFLPIHEQSPEVFFKTIQDYLPHLGLIVSGGNSILFELDENLKIKVLAETVDDAAGEALDKGAKLLGMPYPGAPLLEKAAKNANFKRYDFPRGQNRKIEDDPNFSFSGLKTSLRYFLDKLSSEEISENLPDITASYQYAVVEQLRKRTQYFLKKNPYKSLGISGGVSNNETLKDAFEKLAKQNSVKFLLAKKQHRSDNAAMTAFAAYMLPGALKKSKSATLEIEPNAPVDCAFKNKENIA